MTANQLFIDKTTQGDCVCLTLSLSLHPPPPRLPLSLFYPCKTKFSSSSLSSLLTAQTKTAMFQMVYSHLVDLRITCLLEAWSRNFHKSAGKCQSHCSCTPVLLLLGPGVSSNDDHILIILLLLCVICVFPCHLLWSNRWHGNVARRQYSQRHII